jgi:hypothetical protein
MRREGWTVVASTLLAVLTLGVDARTQDKKPDATPVAATPQDRIDIGPLLDSWYKVMQGNDAVGYVHEVLQRGQPGQPWRYQYVSDEELEIMLPDPKDAKRQQAHTTSRRIRAQLDDTYAPLSMERADKRDELEVNSTVLSEDSGKKIDIVLGPTDRRPHNVSNDEEVHYSNFLMFISLRQNGKLAKAGPQRVLLFSPSEEANRSPLAEVNLEVHDVVKRKYFGDKEVSVTRVTYLKPPPAPNRDAELMETFVDKFGRIVEESTRGGIRRVLVKDEIEAVGKNERVRPGARRDPFRKDLAMYFNPKGKGPAAGGEKIDPPDPSNMAATFKKMEDLIEELKKAKEEKRDDEGQKNYERFLDIQASVRALNSQKPLPPEQLARVETLRKQAEEVWGGLERLMKQLQGNYVKVIEAYNRDDVEEMERGIGEFKKAQIRKELDEQPQLTQVLKWIGELEPLVAKCKTRIELGKKRVLVTGTMIHDDVQLMPLDVSVSVFGHQAGGVQEVRFIKPNRMAVINDKMYRVGDIVEGEGVRIEKIWAFGIQVSLREEVRDVGIRQK